MTSSIKMLDNKTLEVDAETVENIVRAYIKNEIDQKWDEADTAVAYDFHIEDDEIRIRFKSLLFRLED